jgi:hypothetical protein
MPLDALEIPLLLSSGDIAADIELGINAPISGMASARATTSDIPPSVM